MQNLPSRKILTLLCPILASLCLAAGSLRSGAPMVTIALGVGFVALLAWLAARRWPSAWTAGLALVISLAAGVFGVTTGGTAWLSPWLITGVTAGLASWDLILLDASLTGSPPSAKTTRLEAAHYRSLALALGAGLLLNLGGRLVTLRMPMIVMLLLVGIAYYCLNRLLKALGREFHQR
jgi:hypothetical protein